jgi:hypothetical protein
MKAGVIAAVAILWWSATAGNAQLIDPNARCYYPPGSTVCQPMPQPQQQQRQQPPAMSQGEQCERRCRAEQQSCMERCQQTRDFYYCFGTGCGHVSAQCRRAC